MPTISTLAVKLILDTTAFATNTVRTAGGINRLHATIEDTDHGLRRLANASDLVTGKFDRATASARGYLRTLAGIGGGTLTLVKSIKAFSEAQLRERQVARAAGNHADVLIIADAWAELRETVDEAYTTFGRAFAESGNLMRTLEMLTSIVQRLEPVIFVFGSALGFTWNVLANYPPVVLMVAIAAGALKAVLLLLVRVIIGRLLIGFVTWAILGRRLTLLQLIWLGVTKAKTVAMVAYAAAIWAYNAAVTAGIPVTTAFLLVSGGLVLGLSAIAAAAYGMYQIWKYFTGAPVRIDVADADERLKTTKEKLEEIDALLQRARTRADHVGLTKQQIEQQELKDLLFSQSAAGETMPIGPAETAEFQTRLQAEQQREASKQRQVDLENKLKAIAEEASTAAQSANQKRLDELAELGATAEQLAAAAGQLQAIDQATDRMRDREQLIRSIADVEREASVAGLSAMEKRLELARQLGATEAEIARIRAAQARIDQASDQDKLAKSREQQRQRIRDQAERLRESVLTPMEQFEKKMADIERLRKVGAIDDKTANRAAAEAEKALRESFAGQGLGEQTSPQALLKGTAEAALAENRIKNPIERLTDIQRKQLKEATDARIALQEINRQAALRDIIVQF